MLPIFDAILGKLRESDRDITNSGAAPSIRVENTLESSQAYGAIEVINHATSGVGLHITHTDANNSQGLIRLDSPSPEIEFVETDQTSPRGKFEIRVQGDQFSVNGRTAADDGFDEMYLFKHPVNPGVNRITFNAGNTGEDSEISLVESDADNVNLTLVSKGTGKVIIDSPSVVLRGAHDGELSMENTSAGRKYTLPDRAGELAVMSDFNNVAPDIHGFLAWAFDPVMCNNTYTLATAGTMYVIRIPIKKAMTISNIHLSIATGGGTLANSYVAIYQNNTLLRQSSDQSTSWQSADFKTISITATNVVAGSIEIALWVGSWVSAPVFHRAAGQSSALTNAYLAAANSRFATADTGITTTAPNSLGTHSQSTVAIWAAVS